MIVDHLIIFDRTSQPASYSIYHNLIYKLIVHLIYLFYFFSILLKLQVFVYSKQNYQHIKDRLKTRGVAALSRLDLYNYFAPWYAEHLGQIRAASGNGTVEAWAHRKLRLSYYIFTYVSLLKLHGNGNLLRQLDNLLGNEAILSLDLKALTTLFKEPKKREWFQEIIDNYLKLWEINMW